MNKQHLILKIRNELSEISEDARESMIVTRINSLSRTLQLLASAGKELKFAEFADDLTRMMRGEQNFQRINKGRRGELSEGFFKSFEILKNDIVRAMEELHD